MYKKFFASLLSLMAATSLFASGRGLVGSESVFIPKGTFSAGIAAGYDKYNASDGAGLAGIVSDADGSISLRSFQAHAAWFVKDNLSLGLRAGYGNTSVDGDNVNVMDLFEMSNRHIRRELYEASFFLRRYLSISGSNAFGLFAEGRLSGGRGYIKSYENIERGKVGSYSDIYTLGIGLYAGVAAFITDHLSFEIFLPVASAGTRWEKQIESQENESSADALNASVKPNLLGLNLGVVFHF